MKQCISLAVLALLSFNSCRKKDDPVVNNNPVALKFTFQNVAGNATLRLNQNWYQNQNGDSIQLSMFIYYISNIVLTRQDGSTYVEPESYHLIDESVAETKSFTISGLPEGEYTSMSFLIGVDKNRNTSGAQTGALDPAHGMFWDWNTGYVMAKMEGSSPSSSSPTKKFFYHMGGFSGQYSVLRNVNLNFPSPAQVAAGETPNIHIKADALEWFRTPTLLKIADISAVNTPGQAAANIADNYADMFKVDHVD